MSKENIDVSMHLTDTTRFEGKSGALHNGAYAVLNIGPNYPSVTLFPRSMAQVVHLADACLDAVTSMVAEGADIDKDTFDALAALAARAHALSYDEQAEAEAVEAVQE